MFKHLAVIELASNFNFVNMKRKKNGQYLYLQVQVSTVTIFFYIITLYKIFSLTIIDICIHFSLTFKRYFAGSCGDQCHVNSTGLLCNA